MIYYWIAYPIVFLIGLCLGVYFCKKIKQEINEVLKELDKKIDDILGKLK